MGNLPHLALLGWFAKVEYDSTMYNAVEVVQKIGCKDLP
jgi:hypothetical protein